MMSFKVAFHRGGLNHRVLWIKFVVDNSVGLGGSGLRSDKQIMERGRVCSPRPLPQLWQDGKVMMQGKRSEAKRDETKLPPFHHLYCTTTFSTLLWPSFCTYPPYLQLFQCTCCVRFQSSTLVIEWDIATLRYSVCLLITRD